MGFSAKAATKDARLFQAPPALYVTALFLGSADRTTRDETGRVTRRVVPGPLRCCGPVADKESTWIGMVAGYCGAYGSIDE